MSKEWIQKIFVNLGFSKIEIHIYFYLLKEGKKKARDISKALNLYKQQLYRSLKKMQNREIVKSSGYPAYFFAVPFDNILDMSIKTNLDKAKYMIKKKDELLSSWRSIIDNNFSDI